MIENVLVLDGGGVVGVLGLCVVIIVVIVIITRHHIAALTVRATILSSSPVTTLDMTDAGHGLPLRLILCWTTLTSTTWAATVT